MLQSDQILQAMGEMRAYTPAEISEDTGLSLQKIYPVIQALRRKRLIRKGPRRVDDHHQGPGRKTRWRLTERGRQRAGCPPTLQEKIMEDMGIGPVTAREVCETYGVDIRASRYALKSLQQRRMIEIKGKGPCPTTGRKVSLYGKVGNKSA